MKVYELIKQQKKMLQVLHRNGIGSDACKWLPIYDDYCTLVEQGNKITWASAVVANKYGYSERWVRAIVSFMEDKVK